MDHVFIRKFFSFALTNAVLPCSLSSESATLL